MSVALTVLAVAAWWAALSVPVAVATGRALHKMGGAAVAQKPYPLTKRELEKIMGMFDDAGLVRGEPDADGYVEMVFPEEDDAVHFIECAWGGRDGVPVIAQDVRTVLRVVPSGPVTLGVTLVPAWRPAVRPERAA